MKPPLAVAGLILAVMAESCAVGLVGLSGWFIAGSAVAGATAYSTFSYLAPSGGVRAFAVGRILTNYASRVVLHAAALRRVSTARIRFYDRVAARPGLQRTWSGESLDRVIADADTAGMALIQATSPLIVAAAMTVGGCAVTALAGYPLTALLEAVSAALCAALAMATRYGADDPTRTRGNLRSGLVSAIEAWPEMASLGATDQLARSTLRHLATFEDQRLRQSARQARATGVARAATAVAVLLAVISTVNSGAEVSTLVFIALLVAGVMATAERIPPAAEAHGVARYAEQRLMSIGQEKRQPQAATFQARYGSGRMSVSGYWLPEAPTRMGHYIDFSIGAGQTLVITGPSGSGKTTLLDSLATTLRQLPQCVVTAVLSDDFLFTGTVASNIRLANPNTTDDAIGDLLATMALDRSGLEPNTRLGVDGRALSGGEQRRLHIARALVTQPGVLLIDEPTAGLDAITAFHILSEIRRQLPDAVLILAMHEPPGLVDKYCLGGRWRTLSLE